MDSPKMSILKLIQKVESMGHMDFQLAGHDVTRPADVIQGNSPDR